MRSPWTSGAQVTAQPPPTYMEGSAWWPVDCALVTQQEFSLQCSTEPFHTLPLAGGPRDEMRLKTPSAHKGILMELTN